MHSSFVRAPLTISHRIPSSLTVRDLRFTTLMERQIHAPIENAASPRSVYPAHPSAALTASIAARRERLVAPSAQEADTRVSVDPVRERIGLFATEVKR